ncbi:hypothetical protein BP5796_03337 [Coleophoma crateriformis]|uniref:Uncharacterized protein n=1 Tax=Coleophoma crateriformis TaxID=565419 RepID=A0A3D8SMU0_9HELO|nr:hypothetical protein BP5796_03337 [Coleophoma crateriformis]
MLKDRQVATEYVVEYIMVCCSYRGYWKSQGRPSEKGIARDTAATVDWIINDSKIVNGDPKPVAVALWGQSIGAAFATGLAARQELFSTKLSLKALILETPFVSIRAMLVTLYPQKWLPYRYLWPFLRNHLDSWTALGDMKEGARHHGTQLPKILILGAGRDELVDREQTRKLEQRCIGLKLAVQRKDVGGALHTEVMGYHAGRIAVTETIQSAVVQDDDRPESGPHNTS